MLSPRRSPALTPVSAPLSTTPLSRLIYILITLSMLLISYYSYRGLQYKSAVGGWWNLALGRAPREFFGNGQPRCGNRVEESVEDRINGLARILGIPSKELASAIAGAVRQHVPHDGSSSVEEKETGNVMVMEALLKSGKETMEEMPGVVNSVVNSFVGDELDS
ncbi:hypothetical protein BYT27DRAFT_7201157 [Phlegmacium glaucopus]|nr:hypothetical protein BYT27DRAFT_7201157 [Phlegmacium glaucopus]